MVFDVSTPAHLAASAAMLLLMAGMAFAFWRLALGPSLLDRVVALDLIAALAIGMIAAYSVLAESAIVLDAAVMLALTAFLGTVALARFLERRQS
ncbi:MAG: hypothetical protein KFF77_04370 [Bacteroidetes bacterium]|nr:hypothetical protein [Bacteroidota bacterium]